MRHLSGCIHVCITANVLGVSCDLEAQYEPDGKSTTLVDAEIIAFGGTYLERAVPLDIDMLPQSERDDLDRIVNTAHNEGHAYDDAE